GAGGHGEREDQHQVGADVEAADHRRVHGGQGERRRRQGRGAEGGADAEAVADLARQVGVEHAQDDADVRPQGAGVEGHLEVDEVVVGGGDDAARLLDVGPLHDGGQADVGGDELDG